MARIKLDGFQCERCLYTWAPRDKEREPVVCPKCKSPYWNKPRRVQTNIPHKVNTNGNTKKQNEKRRSH